MKILKIFLFILIFLGLGCGNSSSDAPVSDKISPSLAAEITGRMYNPQTYQAIIDLGTLQVGPVIIETQIQNIGNLPIINSFLIVDISQLPSPSSYWVCRRCYPMKNTSDTLGHCLVVTIYNSEAEMLSRPCEQVALNPSGDGHWENWFKDVEIDLCADGSEQNIDCGIIIPKIQKIESASIFGPVLPIKPGETFYMSNAKTIDQPADNQTATWTIFDQFGNILDTQIYTYSIK